MARANNNKTLVENRKARHDYFVEEAMEAGIDGFEAWCPEHDEATSEKFASLAKKNGILAIGGSSFRGRHNRSCVTLGTIVTPEDKFTEFSNYKAKIRRQKAKAE